MSSRAGSCRDGNSCRPSRRWRWDRPWRRRSRRVRRRLPAAPWKTVWLDHISWRIEPWDTEAVRAELTQRGLNPRVDTGTGGDIATSRFKSFHVRDPDGWDLQISNQTKEHHEG